MGREESTHTHTHACHKRLFTDREGRNLSSKGMLGRQGWLALGSRSASFLLLFVRCFLSFYSDFAQGPVGQTVFAGCVHVCVYL